MKNLLTILILTFSTVSLPAQTGPRLSASFSAFEKDAQMKNGIASLHVIEAATGKVVFSKNAAIGLAPASTQKIVTSAAAYEILRPDFRYSTSFGIGTNDGQTTLTIRPSGDPTLGSWRWTFTSESTVISRMIQALVNTGVKEIHNIRVLDDNWNAESIPGGWIWDDIANYYGAGAEALNWRENQFDLVLQSGNQVGDDVQVVRTKPFLYDYTINSALKAAAKGSGDNAYIYFPVGRKEAVVRGTIPAGEKNFTISGTIPSPRLQFISTIIDSLEKRGIRVSMSNALPNSKTTITAFHSHRSLPLDTISYWFLRRSINLYGEALTKSFAIAAGKEASTQNGVKEMKEYWKSKGIPSTELNMYDGSGLSPLNRVTTQAQVRILEYAKGQNWFGSFYHGLPVYNEMKMKSGTINGVKGFCGYHKSADGKEYIFSFLVNNYNGSASGIVQKMYKVLDVLK